MGIRPNMVGCNLRARESASRLFVMTSVSKIRPRCAEVHHPSRQIKGPASSQPSTGRRVSPENSGCAWSDSDTQTILRCFCSASRSPTLCEPPAEWSHSNQSPRATPQSLSHHFAPRTSPLPCSITGNQDCNRSPIVWRGVATDLGGAAASIDATIMVLGNRFRSAFGDALDGFCFSSLGLDDSLRGTPPDHD